MVFGLQLRGEAGANMTPQIGREDSRPSEMRRFHLIFGVAALLLFAATGMVMRTHAPRLRDLGDNVRLMYRSRHIYIFASGMANLLLGVYFLPSRSLWRRGAQSAGSILFLGAPIFLTIAFFAETRHGLAASLWASKIGLDALFAGTLLHFFAADRWSNHPPADTRA
jgi:hypothetical protein